MTKVYRKICKEHWHSADFDVLQKCILMPWIYLRNTKLHLKQSKDKKKCNKHQWTALKCLTTSQCPGYAMHTLYEIGGKTLDHSRPTV